MSHCLCVQERLGANSEGEKHVKNLLHSQVLTEIQQDNSKKYFLTGKKVKQFLNLYHFGEDTFLDTVNFLVLV